MNTSSRSVPGAQLVQPFVFAFRQRAFCRCRRQLHVHEIQRAIQVFKWSFTMPVACINAYAVVGPTNTKPFFLRAFDMATDSGVVAGTSPSVLGALCVAGLNDQSSSVN